MATKYITGAGAGSADGSSWANAWSWATAIGATGLAAGDVGYVSGSVPRTTANDSLVGSSTATQQQPIRLVGCSGGVTLTDGYQGRTNGFGPLVTTNMPTITYTSGTLRGKAYWILENLNISASNLGDYLYIPVLPSATINCVIVNSTNNASACAYSSNGADRLINCDVSATGSSSYAAVKQNNIGLIYGCRITAPNSIGVMVVSNSAAVVVANCLIYSCSYGVKSDNTGTGTCFAVINSTFYNCATTYYAANANITAIPAFINCIVSDSSTYAWDSGYLGTNPLALIRFNNRTRNNATLEHAGAFTNWPTYLGVTTDIGTDFQNAGSGDFRLIAASPAGDAMVPLYGDIGGSQRQHSSNIIVVED